MPSRKGYFLAQIGTIVFIAVLAVGFWVFAIGSMQFAAPATRAQTTNNNVGTVTGGGAALAVSNLTLNNASSIVLIANATETVSVNFTVSGGAGCGNVFYSGGSVTTTLYWSGVSSTCGVADPGANLNNLNCYMVATTTNNCASATSTASANATSTFGVWYFARPTDGTASSSSATSTMGETSILAFPDAGNFGILFAQQATLAQAAAIQSLSFYIDNALGTEHMRLGVYDDDGPTGNPGTKLAETNQLAVAAGWITATTTAQVQLASGTYWLAYEFDTDNIGFRSDGGQSGLFAYYTFTYGAMPATFATTSVATGTAHWSLYATLGTSASTPDPTNWLSSVFVRNTSGTTASASSTGQELLTLTALNVTTSSINYGTLPASSTSGATNQVTTSTNAGNSSTTLRLSVQATLFSGSAALASNTTQTYSTSKFTFQGTSTFLTLTATDVSGFLLTAPTSVTNVAQPIYWGITIPGSASAGTYGGVNLFTAIFSS